MINPTLAVLEAQVDVLAGRIAELESRLKIVVEALTEKSVADQLKLDGWFMGLRLSDHGLTRDFAQSTHRSDRGNRVHALEMDLRTGADSAAVLRKHEKAGKPRAEEPRLWTDLLATIEQAINRYSFDTWFAETRLVADHGNQLLIGAPGESQVNLLRKKYTSVVEEALMKIGRPGVSVTFVAVERS